MSEETNHSNVDKPAVPSNPLFDSGMVLTVILRDDSPMIHCGDSPAYRSVRVDLTPEQVAAIAPRKTGSTGRQEEYESISATWSAGSGTPLAFWERSASTACLTVLTGRWTRIC